MKTNNTNIAQIKIGGAALRDLGNDRYTDDVDYLIYDESDNRLFITGDNDYINAAQNDFYKEVWVAYNNDDISYNQLLAETKAFAFVQHCKNFFFKKADAAEYDLKFLHREFGTIPSIVRKYIDNGAWNEIKNIY